MLIQVIRRHPHGGKYREVGEVYDCPKKKADLLVIIGKAEYADFIEHEPEPEQKAKEPEAENHGSDTGINATDAVVAAAERDGIDLSSVTGSGKDGRILKRDLKDYKTRMMTAE